MTLLIKIFTWFKKRLDEEVEEATFYNLLEDF